MFTRLFTTWPSRVHKENARPQDEISLPDCKSQRMKCTHTETVIATETDTHKYTNNRERRK